MHPYTYSLSLMAKHPTDDLGFLSEMFQLQRTGGWVQGELRTTPKGTLIGGRRNDSYWYANLTDKNVSSEVYSLEDSLNSHIDKFIAAKANLIDFHNTNGRLYISIGFYCDRMCGFTLSVALLKKFADLNIDIDFSNYPE